jgi:serine/threonine protein kinase
VAVKVYGRQENAEHELQVYKLLAEGGAFDGNLPSLFPLMLAESMSSAHCCLVLELLTADLQHELAHGHPLTGVEQFSLIRQVGLALDAMHNKHKILHLDVKPSNILWTRSHLRAALTDFSVSTSIESVAAGDFACSGLYRPPEVVAARPDECVLSPATDAYSFACVVWEVATPRSYAQAGRDNPLFQSKDQHSACAAELSAGQHWATYPHWRRRIAQAGEWGAVVAQLLSPKPADRLKYKLSGLTPNRSAARPAASSSVAPASAVRSLSR